METWLLILIIVCSSLLGILLITLLVGFLVMYLAFSRPRILKIQKEHETNPDPSYDAMEDKEWIKTKHDTFVIDSFDHKKLKAFLFRYNDSHKYLIFAHGYTGNVNGKGKFCHYFLEKYQANVLLIEERAMSTSKIFWCTMGYRESKDLYSWVNYIVSIDKDAEIILYGESMGGATTLRTLAYDLPKNVK